MERKVGVTQARKELGEMIDKVQHQGDSYVIDRHGKPAAAVVPMKVYETWKTDRKEFFDLIRQMQQEADLDPDEAMRIALEAQQAVRAESRKNQ